MSVSYLKGMRTRYRNLLDKEMLKIESLMQDVEDEDIDRQMRQVSTVAIKLEDFSSKYEEENEKFVRTLEEHKLQDELDKIEADEPDFINFITSVIGAISDLTALERQLQIRKTDIAKRFAVEPSRLEKQLEDLVESQSKMQIKTQQIIEVQHSQFQQILQQVQPPLGRGQQVVNPSVSVKLPKLEIMSFKGDILKWKEFWDSFESTVDKNDKLSPVEKFTYLKGKLTDEALDCILGLSVSNENYPVAIGLLEERFGDVQTVINAHYVELMDTPPSPNQVGKLRALFDTVEKHLRSLEAQGQNTNQDVFVSMITSKLPKEVLIQLEMQKGHATKWTVTKLRELLKNYIVARESAERQFSSGGSNSRAKEPPRSVPATQTKSFTKFPLKSSAEALMVGEKGSVKKVCRYCEQSHWSDECSVFPSLESRTEKIRGSCCICLKKNTCSGNAQLIKPATTVGSGKIITEVYAPNFVPQTRRSTPISPINLQLMPKKP